LEASLRVPFLIALVALLVRVSGLAQDPALLLQRVAAAEGAEGERRGRLVWREVQENCELDSQGRVVAGSERVKVFEVLFVGGARYRKLVAKNGKPLSPEEAFVVEEDMRRFAEKGRVAEEASTGWILGLGLTHFVSVSGGGVAPLLIEASPKSGVGKKELLVVDAERFVVLERQSEVVGGEAGGMLAGSRITSSYRQEGVSASLLRRVVVDFYVQAGGRLVHGLQTVTYENYEEAVASSDSGGV
jgi:hypothetical protein